LFSFFSLRDLGLPVGVWTTYIYSHAPDWCGSCSPFSADCRSGVLRTDAGDASASAVWVAHFVGTGCPVPGCSEKMCGAKPLVNYLLAKAFVRDA